MELYNYIMSGALTIAVIVQVVLLLPQIRKQKKLLEFVESFNRATDLSRLEKYGELMEKQVKAESTVTIKDLEVKLKDANLSIKGEQDRFLEVSKELLDMYLYYFPHYSRLERARSKLPLTGDFIKSLLLEHKDSAPAGTKDVLERMFKDFFKIMPSSYTVVDYDTVLDKHLNSYKTITPEKRDD